MVKNHKLAKSISEAAWSQFAQCLEYFGKVYGKTIIAVPPQYTSQECSNCGNLVKKTLSTRTHICGCGTILYRDPNAAKNILAKGLKQAGIILNTVGHTEINAWGQNSLYLLVAASTSKLTDWSKNPRAFRPGSVNKNAGILNHYSKFRVHRWCAYLTKNPGSLNQPSNSRVQCSLCTLRYF